jgi:chaperonin GroES
MLEKLKPLGNRVFIKRLAVEEKTESGLIIPDAAQEQTQSGKVIAVGSGKKDAAGNLISPEVKVGDHVYFGKYAGTKVKDEEYLIISEDEILGILEDN